MPNATTNEAPDATEPAPQSETLVQQIARTYYDLLPAFERHVGMSKSRWGVLILLHRKGELSQAHLQQRLYVDGAAITRQVKQLEEEGLVLRRADPHDNRYTLVVLSEAGRQLTASMVGRRESFEARVTDGISAEEIAILQRSLQRIRENLDALSEKV
ncbi:MAG: MarR family winged helix-turn-helix transcriptional regulator [Roseiflexaceae bacterium]